MTSDRADQQSADSLSWDAIRQQCPRCKKLKASIDFTRNPRFGILCAPCMDKMIRLHQDRIPDPIASDGEHPVVDPEEAI